MHKERKYIVRFILLDGTYRFYCEDKPYAMAEDRDSATRFQEDWTAQMVGVGMKHESDSGPAHKKTIKYYRVEGAETLDTSHVTGLNALFG